MRIISNIIFNVLILVWLTQVYADDPWYVNYENGLKAIDQQEWTVAVEYFNAALSEKNEPGTNAKTYGLRFVDYLPYLYRGIAHYHLGNYEQADADLEQSRSFGEVNNASRDKSAQAKLQEYLRLVEEAQKEARRRKQIQALMSSAASLFADEDFAEAREKVKQVLQLDPDHPEARNLSERIESSLKQTSQEQTVSTTSGKTVGSSSGSETVPTNNPPRARRPETDLNSTKETQPRTSQLTREVATALEDGDIATARNKLAELLKLAPDHPEARSYAEQISQIEQQIKSGIRAYFEGDNNKAIRELNEAAQNCRTNRYLYLFLGSAYSAQYFLSGEEEEQLLQKAISNFKELKALDSDFQPDRRYISPRIIALFDEN